MTGFHRGRSLRILLLVYSVRNDIPVGITVKLTFYVLRGPYGPVVYYEIPENSITPDGEKVNTRVV
jgi:hypothetical protein